MTDTTMKSRQLVERVVITGDLKLLTPTSLGNGDADGLLDIPLARDVYNGAPLLTGSSIAGALRNYLRLRECGYRNEELSSGMAERLFGGRRANDEGSQSPLIVDDARAQLVTTEIRDNVRIEPQTRTAQDQRKFDLELLPSGTVFELRFELLIAKDDDRGALLQALALALTGFEQQEIALGARKRRGFGRCIVQEWALRRYVISEKEELLAWLSADLSDQGEELGVRPATIAQGSATTVLGTVPHAHDKRQQFTIRACFALTSPLLIRSETPIATASGSEYPDTTHLRSPRNGNKDTPILPGTSLAGALRARALRILNTLTSDQQLAQKFLDTMFGNDMDQRPEKPYASRLVVEESEIAASVDAWLVQQRVGIDRFTGGAYDTALFSEAPLASGNVELRVSLQGQPAASSAYDYHAEVGLLLLLLKDLWTGDLPLGGTSSIGRGQLQGVSADLYDTFDPQQPDPFSLKQSCDGHIVLTDTDRAQLTAYHEALLKALGIAPQGGAIGDAARN